MKANAPIRFEKYRDKTGLGCWNWKGAIGRLGYGVFGNGLRQVKAHRFAWEIEHGPIPADLFVCHHCDNRACVRPSHLFLGTAKDNMADAAKKGRTHRPFGNTRSRGERAPKAILTREEVREIRSLASNAEANQAEIAKRYGVSKSAVSHILKGRTWRHV